MTLPMFRSWSLLALVASCAFLYPACSSSESTSDAGLDAQAEASADAENPEASTDAATDTSNDTTNDTRDSSAACATALVIKLGSKSITTTRAQFGYNVVDSGAKTLHMESHVGGDPKCPSDQPSNPEQTVVIANVRQGTVTNYGDGARLSLLDFKGTLTQEPIERATSVTVTPKPSCGSFAFDVDAVFPNGTAKGVIVGEHCTSMDE